MRFSPNWQRMERMTPFQSTACGNASLRGFVHESNVTEDMDCLPIDTIGGNNQELTDSLRRLAR